MSILIERVNESRTELARVERDHATARRLLAELQAIPAVPTLSVVDMLATGKLPDLDERVRLHMKREIANDLAVTLTRFSRGYSDDRRMSLLSDADSVLAVLRDAVASTLDELPGAVAQLAGVSTPQAAIERGLHGEWRYLSQLAADLEVIAREYVKVAVISGGGFREKDARAQLLPHIGDQVVTLPYNVDTDLNPRVDERYALWLATRDVEQLATLRELPDPSLLGSTQGFELRTKSDALTESVFA